MFPRSYDQIRIEYLIAVNKITKSMFSIPDAEQNDSQGHPLEILS